jgi:hypothetical protein
MPLSIFVATGGSTLARHAHDARVRLGGLVIWRLQCIACQAVFTVLATFVLRYRRMRPDVARQGLDRHPWRSQSGGVGRDLCSGSAESESRAEAVRLASTSLEPA